MAGQARLLGWVKFEFAWNSVGLLYGTKQEKATVYFTADQLKLSDFQPLPESSANVNFSTHLRGKVEEITRKSDKIKMKPEAAFEKLVLLWRIHRPHCGQFSLELLSSKDSVYKTVHSEICGSRVTGTLFLERDVNEFFNVIFQTKLFIHKMMEITVPSP